MSNETEKASTETDKSENKQEKSTISKIEVVVETSKEKKEEERPGVCCGSCT